MARFYETYIQLGAVLPCCPYSGIYANSALLGHERKGQHTKKDGVVMLRPFALLLLRFCLRFACVLILRHILPADCVAVVVSVWVAVTLCLGGGEYGVKLAFCGVIHAEPIQNRHNILAARRSGLFDQH